MNLYEINAEIQNLINPETGEVLDYDKLVEMNIALETKKENIALFIKNLLSDADEIEKEKKILAEREELKRNQANRLKEYLQTFLNGEKFETAKVSCYFRKSTVCTVNDEASFIKKCLITIVEFLVLVELQL